MPEESNQGPPSWNGDPASFEQFVQNCKWYEQGLKPSERPMAASRVWQKLTGAAKSVVRHLEPSGFDQPNGLSKLLEVLRQSPLQQLPVPDSFSRLERWSSLRRTPQETIPQLLVREEERFVELQQALQRARAERTKMTSTHVGTSAEEREPPTSPSMSPGFGVPQDAEGTIQGLHRLQRPMWRASRRTSSEMSSEVTDFWRLPSWANRNVSTYWPWRRTQRGLWRFDELFEPSLPRRPQRKPCSPGRRERFGGLPKNGRTGTMTDSNGPMSGGQLMSTPTGRMTGTQRMAKPTSRTGLTTGVGQKEVQLLKPVRERMTRQTWSRSRSQRRLRKRSPCPRKRLRPWVRLERPLQKSELLVATTMQLEWKVPAKAKERKENPRANRPLDLASSAKAPTTCTNNVRTDTKSGVEPLPEVHPEVQRARALQKARASSRGRKASTLPTMWMRTTWTWSSTRMWRTRFTWWASSPTMQRWLPRMLFGWLWTRAQQNPSVAWTTWPDFWIPSMCPAMMFVSQTAQFLGLGTDIPNRRHHGLTWWRRLWRWWASTCLTARRRTPLHFLAAKNSGTGWL